MPPLTKDPNSSADTCGRMMFGYNQATLLWESIATDAGFIRTRSTVENYGGIPLSSKKYQSIASLGGQNFVANTIATTWCPTAISIKDYGTVGWAVGNSTGTDPIATVQFRWYFSDGGAGWVFDGPVIALPGGAHINADQFYVSLDGTFNEPHARVAYGYMSCRIGVGLTAGGAAQTIDIYPRGIYT